MATAHTDRPQRNTMPSEPTQGLFRQVADALSGQMLRGRGTGRRRDDAPNESVIFSFLDRLPAGVFIVDADASPFYANRAAMEILGRGVAPNVSADQLSDVYALSRVGDDEPYPTEELPLMQALAGQDVYADDCEVRRPDRRIPLEVWASPITGGDGSVRYAVAAFVDVTGRREIEAALHTRDTQFRLAMQYAPTGMALCAVDGRWLLLNDAMRRLLGEPVLTAATVHDVIHPDDLAAHHADIGGILGGGAPVTNVERRLVRSDGSVVEALATIVMVPAQSGEPDQLMVQLQDVSGERRLAAERDEYLAELRRSNEDLEQFAYVASHDLSEPLRAISGPISLIAQRYRGELDAEVDDYIEFAVDGCVRMQTLIEDLLTYSRVGKVPRSGGPVDCNLVMATVIDDLAGQIATSGAVIDYEPMPVVWGDAAHLCQVLQNLISNAIKFVPPGQIPRVTVNVARTGDGWRISVVDNGIGIEPRHRDRIFGMFTRLHGRDAYPGTGIGLALVKKIVEHRGGEVGITDAPTGAGTSVWFTTPAAEGHAS